MHHKKAWFLLAVLFGACAIPDVKIDPSLDDSSSGAPSSKGGTKSNSTGGKAGNNTVVGPGGDGGAGNAEQGGEPSVAGTSPATGGKASGSAGTRTTGGGGAGVGGGAGSGSGGTGSMPPPVGAVAKFCNDFTYNGAYVNAELRIGSTRIRADFGTCAPIVNADCTPLAVGAQTIRVWDTDNNVDTMINVPLTVAAGSAYIFVAYVTNTGHYAIQGYDKGPTSVPFTPDDCASLDFDEVIALSGLGGA